MTCRGLLGIAACLLLLGTACAPASQPAIPAQSAARFPSKSIPRKSQIYLAILYQARWPAENVAVEPQEEAWSFSSVDIRSRIAKYRPQGSFPTAGMVDAETIEGLKAEGFHCPHGDELAKFNAQVAGGNSQFSSWKFSEPIYGAGGEALVYGVTWCGNLCADGSIYVVELIPSGWKVTDRIGLWLS